MAGDPAKRNQNLYYHYHQEQGHTTEDCKSLWDHLDQLVGEGKLKSLMHHSSGQGNQMSSNSKKNATSGPNLGIINVIFATPGRNGYCPSRVMSMARLSSDEGVLELKMAKVLIQPTLDFSDEDKVGTIQPHDDTLVVTLRIGGYDVRRALMDQGSAVEILYPDLFKGLNLKSEDSTAYESPLISFEGKTVIPKGQIRLLVQTNSEVVEVDFIVVNSYSPYTAIVARPWLHALGAVSSTVHQKVKYPSEGLVKEILGNQSVARQCMVAAILHKSKAVPSDFAERPS